MNNFNIYSFTYAHLIVHMILINIMTSIFDYFKINNTGTELFKEYYVDNKYKNLVIDFFLIYTYLKTADFLPKYIPIQFRRLIVIFTIDVILGLYLQNTTYNCGSVEFLKRWTNTIGWFAILWDFLLLFIIGTLSDRINMIKFIQKPIVRTIIFGFISFSLLHI